MIFNVTTNRNRDNQLIVEVCRVQDMDMRKGALYMGKKSIEKNQSKVKAIHDQVKKFSSYLATRLYFDDIDWYSNEVDVYEVPTFRINKGTRTVSVSFRDEGSIPKDWEANTSIFFKNPVQLSPIFTAIKVLGISLTPKQEKEIRKAIKNEKNFYYDDEN